MMKTSDKIKKGLECCKQPVCPKDCPYNKPDGICDLTYDMENYISWLEEKVPRWISVEEALPASVIAPCLVYADGQIEVVDWSHDKYGNDWWFYVDGEYEIGVTHWMLLPEPPSEEG